LALFSKKVDYTNGIAWRILAITVKLDIAISFKTAHYGFYITFVSSLIASILYFRNYIINKNIN
jgi:hypothetical protein